MPGTILGTGGEKNNRSRLCILVRGSRGWLNTFWSGLRRLASMSWKLWASWFCLYLGLSLTFQVQPSPPWTGMHLFIYFLRQGLLQLRLYSHGQPWTSDCLLSPQCRGCRHAPSNWLHHHMPGTHSTHSASSSPPAPFKNLFILRSVLLCNPGWLGNQYVAQTGL